MAMERWCVGARVRWFTGALIQNAGDDSIARFSPSFPMACTIVLLPGNVML
jgi:hypothetical protein